MLKTIRILPRLHVEYIIEKKVHLSDKWALISIWSEDELLTPDKIEMLNELSCKKTLSVKFSDLTKDEYERVIKENKKTVFLFEQQHARAIINFVNEIKDDVDELIVHCRAGISRSGAVGLFVCRYLQLDENEFRKINTGIRPNFYILSVLNEVSEINTNYVEFWENYKKEEIERMRGMMMKNQYQIF